jgi:hypothetical protein
MYMPTVVSGGSYVRILYPREYYDSWVDPEGLVRMVCQSTMRDLVHILYPREFYDSWEDPKGLERMVCPSTTNVVFDAHASFCCHMLMMLFQHHSIDDVVVPALCR